VKSGAVNVCFSARTGHAALWLLLASQLFACDSLVDSRGNSGIARLGPAGGTIESDLGVRLYLPPQALASEVTILIAAAPTAHSGVERAIDIRPADLTLLLPGILTFQAPSHERHKIARGPTAWTALPGRLFEVNGLSSPLRSFGTFGLVVSKQTCAGQHDEDADGLVDCADPLCASDAACPQACQTNAECPCGALCNGGGCSAPKPRFCAVVADCLGVTCGDPMSHGAACRFTMCTPTSNSAGGDGGQVSRQVASCLGALEDCTCEACANSNECPGGTTCVPGTRRSGTVQCGRNVCK
jgi:hypothetical protein